MKWTDRVNGFDVFNVVLIALGIILIVAGATHQATTDAQRCHRFYSAAATARDSLWVQTLRPECQGTP